MHFKEAKGILSAQNGLNMYRGCTHGCIYCDSRSKVYGMDHTFEDIEVKVNAPELLEDALRRKRKKCMISTGSMCDPYMPLETELKLTRKLLEIIEHYGFGVTVLTKSNRVLRDLDLLKRIHAQTKAVVQMTLTTFDEELCKILEPHVSTTKERFETLKILRDNGIPTVVWLDPILPFINDTEENLKGILNYCVEAKVQGIICFGMGLTLREGNREYYYQMLDEHFPGLKRIYQRTYGLDYSLMSPDEDRLMKLFRDTCTMHGIIHDPNLVFEYLRALDETKTIEQLTLL